MMTSNQTPRKKGAGLTPQSSYPTGGPPPGVEMFYLRKGVRDLIVLILGLCVINALCYNTGFFIYKNNTFHTVITTLMTVLPGIGIAILMILDR